MSLIGDVPLGMSLPHRSTSPLRVQDAVKIAARSEALGFSDVWVTDNTIDSAYSLDPLVLLAHIGAVVERIRLGVAVVVLPVRHPIQLAHQIASLDYLTDGRLTVGLGLGLRSHLRDFQVPEDRRVGRFVESLAVMKQLWSEPAAYFDGSIFRVGHLENGTARGLRMALKPVQRPHPPLWMSGTHPNATRRALRLGDAWIGSGMQTTDAFAASARLLGDSLGEIGRDPRTFVISKRVFVAVGDSAAQARDLLVEWFDTVYHDASLADSAGVFGTVEEVQQRLMEIVRMGATHLVLNPVADYANQLEALNEVVHR